MHCLPLPRLPRALAAAAGAVLGLSLATGCPAQHPPARPAAGRPSAAPPAMPPAAASRHFSATIQGIDNGAGVPENPAKELQRMLEQVKLNQTSIHKLQDSEFPDIWPPDLLLPQNCYVDSDSVLVYSPLDNVWRGCLLVNLPEDHVKAFFESQFGQFGPVEDQPREAGEGPDALIVRPASGAFAALSVILAKSSFDALWTRVYLEFLPQGAPPAPGAQPPAGNGSNGAKPPAGEPSGGSSPSTNPST
jgi:hypothetical protein